MRAVLGDDGGGQRWRLARLSGRPASGVASADGAAFQLVRRAAMETLAPGQARVTQEEQLSQRVNACIMQDAGLTAGDAGIEQHANELRAARDVLAPGQARAMQD